MSSAKATKKQTRDVVGPKNPGTQSQTVTLHGFEPADRSSNTNPAPHGLTASSEDTSNDDVIVSKNPSAMSAVLAEYAAPPTVFSLGIEHQTGRYFRPPTTGGSFAWSTSGKTVRAGGGRQPRVGVDPDRLEQAGWGVLFADDTARDALAPLLDLRRRQAGDRFAELRYTPGQSAQAFLNEHNAPPGPPDPERAAPYYLTIVGDLSAYAGVYESPELDVRYAVGRLSFDHPDDYARYAAAVVAAESGEIVRSRNVVYFGVEHPGDPVTRLCTERLVEPLAGAAIRQGGWRTQLLTGRGASHQSLDGLLRSTERPALLLAAGHGLVVSKDHPLQRSLQGALLTAEWPGPGSASGVNPDQLFSSSDLAERIDVAGLIALLVGCFTAGTPRFDNFAEHQEIELASSPFVADFPKRLLARGALAALGHVDSLYIHSYAWPGAGDLPQHQTFEALLYHLMAGRRLGHAMDTFGRKYGELAARLLAARLDPGQISEEEYASYWIGYHDSRQYIVLGDPAVRLAVPSAPRETQPAE